MPEKVVFVKEEPQQNVVERGPWKAFATVGNVLGILSFVFSFIPIVNYISLILSEPAIVFSALGKKSISRRGKANAGLVFGILGLVFNERELSLEDKELFNKWNEFKANKDFNSADEIRKILMERNLL